MKFLTHADCTGCDLHEVPGVENVGIPSVWLEGSKEPGPNTDAVVFIGQNPGWEENVQGLPMVGRTGQMVRVALTDGINLRERASVYLTNAVRCWTVGNEKPKKRCIKACVSHSYADLQQIARTHKGGRICLMLLGATATDLFYQYLARSPGKHKDVSLTEAFSHNGQAHTLTLGDEVCTFHVFATFHPAAAMREPNLNHAIHDHMGLLDRFLAGVPAPVTKVVLSPPRYPVP